MKTILLRAGALLAFAVSASAEIIGIEQFEYPDGPIADKTRGTSWDYLNRVPAADASSLPHGIILDGNSTARHFVVGDNRSLTLRALTLTRGGGDGSFGGSIFVSGQLELSRCTLTENHASDGGAIWQTSIWAKV